MVLTFLVVGGVTSRTSLAGFAPIAIGLALVAGPGLFPVVELFSNLVLETVLVEARAQIRRVAQVAVSVQAGVVV